MSSHGFDTCRRKTYIENVDQRETQPIDDDKCNYRVCKTNICYFIQVLLFTLKKTVPCDVENNCHENASCDWIEADLQNKCICKEGYTGDGYECELESCQIVCEGFFF